MEQNRYEIRPGSSIPECSRILSASALGAENLAFELHFNQNEEMFLRLPGRYRLLSLPVHHDVRDPDPSAEYVRELCRALEQIVAVLPEAFGGLTHYFDPSDTLHPGFYKLFKAENALYLYVLRIDLSFRPNVHTKLRSGGNDMTAEYETRDLFLESEFIPLDSVEFQGREIKAFKVDEMVSQTWIGETGKGYMLRGIWMDADLSKFFTKLFLPEGKSVYPYFPLFCKYKSVCGAPLRFDSSGRKDGLSLFHRQASLLRPWIGTIEKALKQSAFSETMREFEDLRRKVPASWIETWAGMNVRSYLNEADMKEYLIEF
jgi:hypothetical protein